MNDQDSNQPSIGILGGTGPAGSGLAARLASIGHNVVIGSRSKYKALEARDVLAQRWPEIGEHLVYGDNATAAQADIVVIATPWGRGGNRGPGERGTPRWQSRDLDGQRAGQGQQRVQPLVPPRGSVAAHVQAAVPRCRLVAAFHHLPAAELGKIDQPIDSDVLVCGDDRDAVREVSDIVARIPGCRPLDAGELSNAMAIEAFTAVLLQLNVRYKTRVAPRLTGINDPS